MKKWLSFFCLSFFSDKASREGAKRGYTNVFVALLLAFVFLWAGFVGADMLPFPSRYNSSEDFAATVHSLLANPDSSLGIEVEIDGSRLRARGKGGEYASTLLVNTFESDPDRQSYSVGGYNVIVDTRPASTLAEIEAYCLSNDGKGTEISYRDYLTLSEVARLNFDFKLRYTGRELVLKDGDVAAYRAYLGDIGNDAEGAAEELDSELAKGKIEKNEYNRKIYELYFENYYPDITAYESASSVPLLRNYYYREYIEKGECKYLFIFDDYMAASFVTDRGANVSFYGFYSGVEDGVLVEEGAGQAAAEQAADEFIKSSYASTSPLAVYAHAVNVFSLIPFIALMPMAVTLLMYSILKLRGAAGALSLGGAFKVVGSYIWFSALAASVLCVLISFLAEPDVLTVLPLLLFFTVLAVRSVIFTVREIRAHTKQSVQTGSVQTEE